MNVWQLVLQEIVHRKLNFVLTLLSVAIAIACLVGAQTMLRGDQIQTAVILDDKKSEVEAVIAKHEAEVDKAGKELEDATRKQMLKLGFNVLIVPENQDLSKLHLDGTLTSTMPEAHVDTLANSKIVTINHLLPSINRRVTWPEREIEVILYGTRGEVPIMHRGLKKMLLNPVEPGTMVVGYQVHQKLGLEKGQKVTLMGEEFTVSTLHPERGSADDVTVWIDLKQAQKLLEMENLINAILALECGCAGDRITQIREEIAGILPGTKVIERYSQAVTRAESREKAKVVAEEALKRAKANGQETIENEETARRDLEENHAGLAGILVPLVLVACAVWIAILAYTNVRQRSSEIGILRAIGLRSGQILNIFVVKAAVIGLIGGIIGAVAGLWTGLRSGGMSVSAESWAALTETSSLTITLVAAVALAPVFSAIAGWLPAMAASRQDPAVVLQQD